MKKKLFLIGVFVFSLLMGCSSDGKLQKENDTDNTENRMNVSEGISEREASNTDADVQPSIYENMHEGKAAPKEHWQSAYIEYLMNSDYKEWLDIYTYSLIYVNDDDIPELVVHGGCEADGCIILTYKDGNIDVLQTARLNFIYIEKENLLDNASGIMGAYYDYIYTIEEGKWTQIASGERYEYVDENVPLYDENGNYIYDVGEDYLIEEYYWNGNETTYEGYYNQLEAVFDLEKSAACEKYYSVDEILCLLKTGDVSSADHRYELMIGDVTWEEAQELCKEKGGYLATITTAEEFERITEQISQEEKNNVVFWVGANRVEEDGGSSSYHWVDDRLKDGSVLRNGFWKYWLYGEPSYSGLTEDGQEVKEEYVVLMYKRAEGKYYFNDVPNDILAAAPSYQGIVGYICEYDE